MLRTFWSRARDRRARRALERQLDYQRHKARLRAPDLDPIEDARHLHAQWVWARINALHSIADDARVLEVGSGAHGHVFFLDLPRAVGVDPLAIEYARLFPEWQSRLPTIAARGEALPFAGASFDVVISDNVVDHARDPRRIVEEVARVLAPGGVLYFTVHVHHPAYRAASSLYGAARALGVPVEVGPFADHTVHFTVAQARALFAGLPLRALHEDTGVAEARREGRRWPPPRLVDLPKRWLWKNALYQLVAERT
jgi:SAM-dependent methyltransferase